MRFLPRHAPEIGKAFYWILSALLFYIGVTKDIPEFLANKTPLLSALGGETLIRAVAVLLFFVVAVLAIGPIRLQEWKSWTSRHIGSKKRNEELKRRCCELSQEIYRFVGDRRRDDPHDKYWQEFVRAETEEDKQRLWDKQNIESSRYSTDTMARYRERFEGEALALFGAAKERGWVNAHERGHFEHPTNLLGIEEVAQRLCSGPVGAATVQ